MTDDAHHGSVRKDTMGRLARVGAIGATCGAAALVLVAVLPGTTPAVAHRTVAAVVRTTASASATPSPNPGGYPRAFIEAQDRLLAVADPIVAIADPSESQHPSRVLPAAVAGFAGISIDVRTSTLHLAWKGRVPDAVRRILRTAPASVRIDLRPARHSLAELRAGQKAVVAASPKLVARLGVSVVTVFAGTTGAGLTVGYDLHGATRDPGAAAVVQVMRTLVGAPIVGAELTGRPVSL